MLVALLPLATIALPAHIQAGPLAGIEGMTSTVFQRDQSSFSGIGLKIKIQPPQLVEGFTVVPMLEYWRAKSTVRAFGIESTRKDATLGTFMRYDFQHEGWQPYVGLGLGLHFISDEVDAPSLGLNNESDSLIKGGLLFVGGAAFGLSGNLGNLLEAEYHHLPGQGQFKVNWGLTWRFAAPSK
jgi:hypothetical protein